MKRKFKRFYNRMLAKAVHRYFIGRGNKSLSPFNVAKANAFMQKHRLKINKTAPASQPNN